MTQHATLTVERWGQFSLAQRLLMIANEMNRCSKLMAPADLRLLRGGYERVLALTDLTIQLADRRSLRRELLRLRDLFAALYILDAPNPADHAVAFRALLQLHPETWKQRDYVTGAAKF